MSSVDLKKSIATGHRIRSSQANESESQRIALVQEGQRLHPIFNCKLVNSIRAKHANLTMIAEYEENDLFEYYCCASDTELEETA